MDKLLLSPPVAFLIVLTAGFLFYWLLSGLAFKRKARDDGQKKPYACGENVTQHRVQPDYSQFFPFVFFFTIMHVVTLFIATIPVITAGSLAIAVIYLLCAVIALSVLYRK